MLYDSFGRRIRKPRYFGFGRTPAKESEFLDPDQAGSETCDAIGFHQIDVQDPEIECKKDLKCEISSRR